MEQTKPQSKFQPKAQTPLGRFKPYLWVIFILIVDGILSVLKPTLGISVFKTSWDYLFEMLTFIPPIFVLMGLLDVWVPRELIEKSVGPNSGWRGIIISILVGTAAAGPLYAAFPLAATLWRKGAKVSNIMIFLNTWAAIKIPMITVEMKYIGFSFALLRLLLTLPFVILIGYLVESWGQKATVPLSLEE